MNTTESGFFSKEVGLIGRSNCSDGYFNPYNKLETTKSPCVAHRRSAICYTDQTTPQNRFQQMQILKTIYSVALCRVLDFSCDLWRNNLAMALLSQSCNIVEQAKIVRCSPCSILSILDSKQYYGWNTYMCACLQYIIHICMYCPYA